MTNMQMEFDDLDIAQLLNEIGDGTVTRMFGLDESNLYKFCVSKGILRKLPEEPYSGTTYMLTEKGHEYLDMYWNDPLIGPKLEVMK